MRPAVAAAVLSLGLSGVSVKASAEVDKLQWIKNNATVVRSVDIQDGDFSDLRPLIKEIGDARVVMLGEVDHSDGTTFLAKGRLIRFLHEVMGFDVLVWESGVYDCRVFDAALSSDLPMDEVAKKGAFNIWTRTQEVRLLMDYARRTRSTLHPLEMAGMDPQFSSTEAPETYPSAVFAFFDRVDPALLSAADRELFRSTVKWLVRSNYVEPTEQSRQLEALIGKLRTAAKDPQFVRMHGKREVLFMDRTLHTLHELIRLNTSTARIAGWHIAGLNIRNKAMGENLAWLAKVYYPDRKIMVWAASSHLSRNGFKLEPTADAKTNERFQALREAGDTVLKELGAKDVYSIGFSGYQMEGTAASADSFDGLCHESGHEYLFVDLKNQPRDSWLRQSMEARIFGLPLKGDWSQMFDGIFFMDTVAGGTAVKPQDTH